MTEGDQPDDAAYRHDLEVRRLAGRERIWIAAIALLERMIVPGAALGIVYICYRGLEVVAGVVTSEVIKTALESNLWGILLGGAGLTYGLSVRIRFRASQNRQSREHQHTKEIEMKIWPERTSSDMPYTGETKKGD